MWQTKVSFLAPSSSKWKSDTKGGERLLQTRYQMSWPKTYWQELSIFKIFLKFLYGNRPTDIAKPQQNSEYLTEIDKMLKCVFNGVTECFILCKAFFPCCVKSSLKFKKGLNHVFIFLLIHNNALSSSPDVWTNGLPQWLKGIDPRKEQVHSLKVFNTISIHKHRETL